MRSSKSRSRSKANRPRSMGNIINRVFDSSGPEGKVRGTPQQIIEKYLVLARDAQLSNDRVAAENFLQHAEHYTRMLGEAQRELAAEQEARQAQYAQNGHQGNGNGNGNGGRQGGERFDRREDRYAPRPEAEMDDQPAMAAFEPELPEEFGAAAPEEPAESALVETPEARAPRQNYRPRPPRAERAERSEGAEQVARGVDEAPRGEEP